MSKYRDISTPELIRMWEKKRDFIARNGGDTTALIEMRKEIDRREQKPSREIDFEKYLTD